MSSAPYRVNILTIFPGMFDSFFSSSILGRAVEQGLIDITVTDIRPYSQCKHHNTDDYPFGGGAGMVMRPDVLGRAVEAVHKPNTRLIYFSPRGTRISQQMAEDLAKEGEATVLCGRFEGIDERVLQVYPFEEVSLGDFVLSGGEPAALALLDAIVRLLPGVMGSSASLEEESFSQGLLEYPQYTRPAEWKGLCVPEVLNSGHHGRIAEWRLAQAEELTKQRRPDLWNAYLETAKSKRIKK